MINLEETTFPSSYDLMNHIRTLEAKPEDIPGKIVKGMVKDSCLWLISFTDGTYTGADAGDYCFDDAVAFPHLSVFEKIGVLPKGMVKRHQEVWSRHSQKQYEDSMYSQYKTLAKKFGPLPPEEIEKL